MESRIKRAWKGRNALVYWFYLHVVTQSICLDLLAAHLRTHLSIFKCRWAELLSQHWHKISTVLLGIKSSKLASAQRSVQLNTDLWLTTPSVHFLQMKPSQCKGREGSFADQFQISPSSNFRNKSLFFVSFMKLLNSAEFKHSGLYSIIDTIKVWKYLTFQILGQIYVLLIYLTETIRLTPMFKLYKSEYNN